MSTFYNKVSSISLQFRFLYQISRIKIKLKLMLVIIIGSLKQVLKKYRGGRGKVNLQDFQKFNSSLIYNLFHCVFILTYHS